MINKFLDKFKDQLNYNFFEIIYDIKHDLDIIILYIIIYKAKNLIIIKFNDIYEKVYIFLLEYCWNIEWVNFNNKVFVPLISDYCVYTKLGEMYFRLDLEWCNKENTILYKWYDFANDSWFLKNVLVSDLWIYEILTD